VREGQCVLRYVVSDARPAAGARALLLSFISAGMLWDTISVYRHTMQMQARGVLAGHSDTAYEGPEPYATQPHLWVGSG